MHEDDNGSLGRKLGNFFIWAIFCCLLQEGRTPLHYSAALHDSGIFYRYLLKCGADENIQDKVKALLSNTTHWGKNQFFVRKILFSSIIIKM